MKVLYLLILAIYLVGGVLLLRWMKRTVNRDKDTDRFIYFVAKTFFIVMILEVTIFNLPAFHLWFGDYEETTLSLADAEIEGKGTWIYDEENGTITIEKGQELSLYFGDIDQPVGTIYMDAEFSEKAFTLDVDVDATDETHQAFREGVVTQTIYRFEESSQTILCHLSGDVGALRINLSAGEDDSTITISNIKINVPVTFSISIVRILALWGFSVLAYALVNLGVFKRSVEKEKQKLDALTACVFVIAMVLAALLVIPKISAGNLREVFCSEEGDQITQELVDAFEAGSVSLLIEPDENLTELSNPYDRSLRDSNGVTSEWDHVYYEGKYYSYYGIAPVILFFLPFHLITGYYFSTKVAVLIFSIVGIWFLLKIYTAIVRKWFGSLPLGLVFGGELVLTIACGIFYPLSRPKFYELAVACAFMFLTAGVYFLLTSDILGEGRIKRARLALSSLLLGLAVLSRPTMAVYCICACVFYLVGFKKWRRTEHGFILYWLCACFPWRFWLVCRWLTTTQDLAQFSSLA